MHTLYNISSLAIYLITKDYACKKVGVVTPWYGGLWSLSESWLQFMKNNKRSLHVIKNEASEHTPGQPG